MIDVEETTLKHQVIVGNNKETFGFSNKAVFCY